MNHIVLVGGGGHARACLDVIQAGGRFHVAGILDHKELLGTEVLGVPIIGTDQEMPALVKKGMSFLVAVGQIKTPETRMRLFSKLQELDADMPLIIAPSAHVSQHAKIGEGTLVMHMAMIGPGVRIGVNCIINNRALVEHDTQVGDHCHVATGALVNGGCILGQGAFIGSGAILRQGVRIGEHVIVGMGALVDRDLAAGEIFQ